MISARYCLFLLFCEKSLKTLPFLLPFSRKGQTEEKFLHQKKNFFLSETTYEYREEYTEEEEEEEREKRRRERDRSFVVAETERLKSSDRPRCGPGIKGVASLGYFSI
jgi:hypothetical protein